MQGNLFPLLTLRQVNKTINMAKQKTNLIINELTEQDRAYLAAMADLSVWIITHSVRSDESISWTKYILFCREHSSGPIKWINSIFCRGRKTIVSARQNFLYDRITGERASLKIREFVRFHIADTDVMVEFLDLVEPYLKFKKEHARIMREFLNTYYMHARRDGLSSATIALRYKLIEEFKKLT